MAITKFSIYSPSSGLQKSYPNILLKDSFMPESKNIQLWNGSLRTAALRVKEIVNASSVMVQMPDGNPVLRHETLVRSDLVERFVAFTKEHVYYWDNVAYTWQTIFTSSTTTTTYWDADQYGDWLVFTNNIDRPQQWNGNTASSANIDTQYSDTSSDYIAKAMFIRAYRDYLFLGNVQYSDGSRFANDAVSSNIGKGVDTGAFRQDLSDSDSISFTVDGAGDISGGFGEWQGYLVVFKRHSMRRIWYVGGTIPFSQDSINSEVGCICPGSVINDKEGKLYWFGSDNHFREITLGQIGSAIATVEEVINPTYALGIRSFYTTEYDEIYWAIPYGSLSTGNNTCYVYKATEGKWMEREIPVTAFGKYTNQLTYSWSNLPYANWSDWSWDSWNSIETAQGAAIDVCSDSSGYTYKLHGAYSDKETAYSSYIVLSTSLTSLNLYKRVLRFYLYFYGASGGTVALSVKRDNESTWQALGTVTLDNSADIIRLTKAVDFRSKHMLIKIESTSAMNFVGAEFDYQICGER